MSEASTMPNESGTDDDSAETPEAKLFRSLPQSAQRRLLYDHPRQVAVAMHAYSRGDHCEAVLQNVLSSDAGRRLLKVRNANGDSAIAAAMLNDQTDRAAWLLRQAEEAAGSAADGVLKSRSRYRETLPMLATRLTGEGVADLLERLLNREPSQLHRLYDVDGRNLLHHCALEKTTGALDSVLQATWRLMQDGRLDAVGVSQALHMNDAAGNTPAHLMAQLDRADMLDVLTRFAAKAGVGLDLNARCNLGDRRTPLMAAAAAGAAKAVAFLLAREETDILQLEETDQRGFTAAQLASGWAQIAALFSAAGIEGNSNLSGSAAVDSVDSGVQSFSQAQTSAALVGQRAASDATPPASAASTDSLTPEELRLLECRLTKSGKANSFLAAMLRLEPRLPGMLLETDSPVDTAFSVWSHCGQPLRGLVQRALTEVGEDWGGGGDGVGILPTLPE